MKLPIPIYSSSVFQWKNGNGSAERSDAAFVFSGGRFGFVGARAYDDACDIAFDVKSARTGKISRFYYVHDEDGYDGELEVYQNDAGNTITIFND